MKEMKREKSESSLTHRKKIESSLTHFWKALFKLVFLKYFERMDEIYMKMQIHS